MEPTGWSISQILRSLRPAEANATFSGPPGDYVLHITATDANAAEATFLVTVHVTDATWFVPPEVQRSLTCV